MVGCWVYIQNLTVFILKHMVCLGIAHFKTPPIWYP
jgi:hypothetical protein